MLKLLFLFGLRAILAQLSSFCLGVGLLAFDADMRSFYAVDCVACKLKLIRQPF